MVGWRVIREKYVWRNKRTSCKVKQGQFVPTELWFHSIFALQRRMAERPEQAWQEGWEEAIGLHSQDFQRRRMQWLLMVKWWKAADTKGHPREILREKLPQQDKTSFINRSEGEGISGTAEEETYLKSTWSPNFSANTEQEQPSVAESLGPEVSALWESLCHSSEAAAETSATHSDVPECRMSPWHKKSSWQQGTRQTEEVFSAFLQLVAQITSTRIHSKQLRGSIHRAPVCCPGWTSMLPLNASGFTFQSDSSCLCDIITVTRKREVTLRKKWTFKIWFRYIGASYNGSLISPLNWKHNWESWCHLSDHATGIISVEQKAGQHSRWLAWW